MMPIARLISSRQELIEFLNSLAEETFFEKIYKPDTKWRVVNITNITFYVYHQKDMALDTKVHC